MPDRATGRILVTGVPGWLTSALLSSLLDDPPSGFTGIRCLVQPGPAAAAVRNATRDPRVEYVVADLGDAGGLQKAVHGMDSVLHAAGLLHVRHTRQWYEVNARGTERLLEASRLARIERFVLVSSNAAAGRSSDLDHLMVESDQPKPRSHYGRSKLLAEQATARYQGAALQTVILRPCMFYGPPVPVRHTDVYRRIQSGRMPVVGSGQYARSLTYIDNLVQGCRLALTHGAAAGQTYYIADRDTYTTLQVTEAMAAALDAPLRTIRIPRLVAPVAYWADLLLAWQQIYWQTLHLVGEADWHVGVSCAKAARELGYDPRIGLHEGMRRAVEWCYSVGSLTRRSREPAATTA